MLASGIMLMAVYKLNKHSEQCHPREGGDLGRTGFPPSRE
jgi:hypothetical protein